MEQYTTIYLYKMSEKSKSIGNKFENEISKKLSLWIMNKPNYFIRSITSGALKNEKSAYNGDIIPVKFNEFNWIRFPFLIECKCGYENSIPDFWNFNIITNWLNKLEIEKNNTQNIIMLIVKFKLKKILFITNIELLLEPKLIIGSNKYFIYDFNELTSYEFLTLFKKINSDWYKK